MRLLTHNMLICNVKVCVYAFQCIMLSLLRAVCQPRSHALTTLDAHRRARTLLVAKLGCGRSTSHFAYVLAQRVLCRTHAALVQYKRQ